MQARYQFAADVSTCRLQAFHGCGCGVLVPLNHDQDAGRARIGSKNHLTHIGKSNARVAQLSLENGLDFLAQRFAQPLSMIFLTASFQRISLK